LIRPIFNADSLAQARERLSEAVAHLDGRLAKVATLLEDAEPDILALRVPELALAQAQIDQPARALSTRRSAAAPTSSASSPATAP
jgi:hypothetical protein